MGKKMTTEEFVEKLKYMTKGEYVLLSEYESSNKKVIVKHIKCGKEYMVTPNNILSCGNRCPHCNLQNKKNNLYEVFISLINKDGYSLVGEYNGSKVKVKVRHDICGEEYYVFPEKFIDGNRCRKCYLNKMFINKINRIKESYDGCFDISYDLNDKKFLNVTCLKCEEKFITDIKSYDKRITCNNCKSIKLSLNDVEKLGKYDNRIRNNTIKFIEEVKEYTNGEYILLSDEVVRRCDKVRMRHEKCGYEFMVAPSNFIRPNNKYGGTRCPKCSGKMQKTHDEFIHEVSNIYGEEYTVLSEYKGNKSKIKVKHNVCGNLFEIRADHFIGKRRDGCPVCNASKGEREIRNILNKKHINFEEQKTFEGCKFINSLYFDFYLPSYAVCIEFDGKQHYEPLDIFGGEDDFRKRVQRDKIKNEFCCNNNVNLLRIKYTDINNIEKIILDFLDRV